ncbi:hypothetical protein [Methylorubrum thiocyanatum]|uniref:hypothetical protein n=1 Tax=Methylorubrum thiocyanatum TaxID=47958 RepID=UPI00398C58B2
MAGGLAFDPAEFAAFKARSRGGNAAPQDASGGMAPASSSSGGFDPAEFEAFKTRRAAPPAAVVGGEPEALRLRVGAPSAPTQEPNPFRQDVSGPRAVSFDERFGDGPSARTVEADAPEAMRPLAEGLRREADERLVGAPSAATPAIAALYRAGNAAGLNLPRNAAAGLATAFGAVGVPGYSPRSFSQNYERAAEQEEAFARQAPKSAIAGTVAGIVGGAAALPAIPARAGAGLAGRALANAATGAGYGAVAEFADSKDAVNTLGAAALGGGLGAAGGYAIDRLAPVVSRMFSRGVPFRDQTGQLTGGAQAALREAGIDPAGITPDLAARIEASFTAKGPSAGAAREALAADQGITLSRGQATRDPAVLTLEGVALSGGRGGRAQQIGDEFATRQAGEIDAARGRLQAMAARGGEAIDNPAVAFEAVADRARQVGGRYADDVRRAENAQGEALRAVRGDGPADVLDGATLAVQGARDAAGQARAAYGQAYDDLDAVPGTFAPDAFAQAGRRIRGMLGPETPIAPSVTPAASRALDLIEGMGEQLGLRPGEGPTLQQVNLIRKGISNLYGATGQNGTDRAALGAVRDAFDRHVQDMSEIGLFRTGGAPRGPAPLADDVAGAVGRGVDAPPPDAIPLPAARDGEPESLTRYLARNGGIPLDDEARAADLNRLYVPGGGTLARRNAPTWDQIRVRLAEQGFFPGDEMAGASPRDVADRVREAIRAERQGRPLVRMADEGAAGARRGAERVADENADFASQVDREARRIAIDLEGVGVTGSNLDQAALREAAEARVLGRGGDDGVAAYDAAVARRGADGDDVPFDAPSAAPADVPFPGLGDDVGPAGDVFPAGDAGPAEAMRKARGLFREYKRAFAPRGPGDVAGQRLQRIVERDASPNEAVSMLFGTTTGRVGAGQIQTLARLREAVGSDSETWRATQQALIARYVGGDGRDLASRLDYLLRGDGRSLTPFLTAEQRTALGRLRGAVQQTEAAQAAAPTWVQDLERSGFDPNRIASSLFGSGVPGTRAGALNEARAAKGLLGENSQEWSMLRQAAVQRLTDRSANAAKMAKDLGEFTSGRGAGLARELFSPEEIGQLRRFSAALQATLRPDGSVKPNANAAAGVAAKALDVLAGMVAFKVGGPGAGLATYGAKVGQRALVGGVGARSARRSFEGGAPRLLPPAPVMPTDRLAVGGGLAVGQ